ncbi:CMP-N-acetylneuraminate-beta-galactosamide-alpha-2,3-sialyltransferase 4 isoform 1-T3 [Synchiropus picturatus]
MTETTMAQIASRTWCLRLLPVAFVACSFLAYYCSYSIIQSSGTTVRPLNSSRTLCSGWNAHRKWESLNLNISRQKQLFLKLGDFFWRDHGSQLALPYGVKGSELQLLKVLAMTPYYQLPAHIEKLDCRSCVVVGNGYVIKNRSLGGVLNSYDVVIRLNNAPVRGYEEDVGNKTTMRFFYPESASVNPSLNNEPDTLMVLVPFKQQDLRWLKEILYDEKRVRKGFWRPPPQIWLGDASKVRVLNPHFMRQTAERLLHIPFPPQAKQVPFHPTTGILAVFVALNFCDVVHVAGFGYPSSQSQRLPIHYYGHDTMNLMKNSNHDLGREAKALRGLEEAGAIVYLHPHL